MKSADSDIIDLPPPEIIERGRGPEIKGTRITVYRILDYLLGAWPVSSIAQDQKVTPGHVQAAIDYVREHKIEVLTEYVKILERCERGNPPELQAKLDACAGKARALMERIREARARGASDAEVDEMVAQAHNGGARRDANGRDHGRQ